MLIIAGHLRVDEADRDGYLAECRSVVETARRAPGCLDFSIAADPLELDRVNVFERWDSDEELDAFRGTGPDPGLADRIRDAQVRKFRISATE